MRSLKDPAAGLDSTLRGAAMQPPGLTAHCVVSLPCQAFFVRFCPNPTHRQPHLPR